jgi:hypothetical protein
MASHARKQTVVSEIFQAVMNGLEIPKPGNSD